MLLQQLREDRAGIVDRMVVDEVQLHHHVDDVDLLILVAVGADDLAVLLVEVENDLAFNGLLLKGLGREESVTLVRIRRGRPVTDEAHFAASRVQPRRLDLSRTVHTVDFSSLERLVVFLLILLHLFHSLIIYGFELELVFLVDLSLDLLEVFERRRRHHVLGIRVL